MIIHCPNCNTRYNLTAAQLGPKGRTVRCVKCAHEWMQAPVNEEVKVEEPKAPIAPENPQLQTEISTLKRTEPVVKNSNKKVITIAASIAATVVVVVGGYFAVNAMMHKGDKPTAKVEKVLPTGLIITDNIERSIIEEDGLTVLVFSGNILNTANQPVDVVPPRITLLNAKGDEIDSFPSLANKKSLNPNETATWVCRFFNPPLDDIAEYNASF